MPVVIYIRGKAKISLGTDTDSKQDFQTALELAEKEDNEELKAMIMKELQ